MNICNYFDYNNHIAFIKGVEMGGGGARGAAASLFTTTGRLSPPPSLGTWISTYLGVHVHG